MAKVRNLGLLPTSLATRALAITFQSVTTSARADAADSAAATMPGSKAADELKPDFIGRLPFSNGDTTARTLARRCEDREKVGLISVMPADGTNRCPLSSTASSARLLFKGSYKAIPHFR